MEICAGDGFRMAYQTLPLAYPAENRVTIPGGSVDVLCTLWDKVPAPISPADTLVKTIISKRSLDVSLSKERLIAHFGKITLLSNLIQGTAPNFAQLIPKDPPLKVTLLAPEMERCIRRVKGIAQSGNGAIRLSWSDNKLTISAKGEDNSASAEMGVASNDTGGRIAVYVNYIMDYLSKKEGVVTISITNEQSPILLRYGKAPLVVVMPMQVDWGDKKPTVEEEPEPEVAEPVDESIDETEDIVQINEEEPEKVEVPSDEPPKRKRKARK
jgi:DNA polymerase-3 subunit beta